MRVRIEGFKTRCLTPTVCSMGMFGGIASMLQDNGGVGVSDPYSDTDNIGSSFSDLATQLVGSAADIGDSYLNNNVTGNQLAPTQILPNFTNLTSYPTGVAPSSSARMLEYGIVALIALVIVVKMVK